MVHLLTALLWLLITIIAVAFSLPFILIELISHFGDDRCNRKFVGPSVWSLTHVSPFTSHAL